MSALGRFRKGESWSPPPLLGWRELLAQPALADWRPTWKRRSNLILSRFEYWRGRTNLRSYPTRLVVEPASACNLRCPYCVTGAGGVGRPPGLMTLDLYRKLLDELGDYLLEVDAFQWGEPLLNPHLDVMIREANERGIATAVNTNLNLQLDDEAAARLVSSGLTELTVSIDGVRQETYEQYRVRGGLERVLENCRRIVAAKRKLASKSPRFNFEFHVFPHNVADVEQVEAMARELKMNPRIFKGVVPGAQWGKDTEFRFCVNPIVTPCIFLWGTALVTTDGGCLPCRGAFYAADDMGKLAIHPRDLGAASFRAVWNSPRYRAARALFHDRTPSDESRRLPCFDCPNTLMWERWKKHRAQGGSLESFDVGFSTNDIWNYFWDRRPTDAIRSHAPGTPQEATASTALAGQPGTNGRQSSA